MANIEQTIRKAMQIATPEVLKNTEELINLLEDLSPELVAEKTVLKRIYSDELGKLLYEVYCSRDLVKGDTWREVRMYLDETMGLKEARQTLFLQWFKDAFTNNNLSQISGTKMSYVDQDYTINDKRQSLARIFYKMSILKAGIESAIHAENNGDIIKAISIYQQYNDGSCYEREAKLRLGQLYESFPEEAYKYYLRSAQLGDAEAAFRVGYMNEYGKGIEKNMAQAITFYNQAAQADHRGAFHNLGCLYYYGDGVEKDLKRAFELFYLAAQKGKTDSMRNVGVMYENGDYVKRDYDKALFWYTKAVDYGYSEAAKDCQRVKQHKEFARR